MNSCKKDTEPEPTSLPITTTYPNFSRLKVGNYWIYQQFDIDQNGNATPKNIFDSCYVEKDTLINGKTYMKIIKPSPFNQNEKEVFTPKRLFTLYCIS